MVSTNYGSFNNEFTATKLMLNFFKLLGLAPFIVQSSSIPKMWKRGAGQGSPDVQFVACRLGRLYGLLLVPLQFRMVLIAWPVQFAYEYPDKSSMSKTISECESVLHNTVLFVVWLAAAVKQKTAVKILNRLVSFDVVTFCRDEDSFSESSRWFFALGSSANVLVWTGLLFTEWWTYRAPVLTWFAIIVPTFFLTWFLMQYVFVVKLIEKRFRALNRAVLAESVDSSMGFQQRSPVARNALMNDSRGPKITTISRGHTNLYEIAMDTSDFYSLPILLTIAFVSYTALYNTYYITVPFFNEVEEDVLWIIVNCVFWVISVMFPVAMLTFGVTNVAREIKNTADVVRVVLNRSTTRRREILELKEFAMELLHRKIEFTACGFFPLDCTLLHSIFTMIVGYLIILIQFQLASHKNIFQHDMYNKTITESSTLSE